MKHLIFVAALACTLAANAQTKGYDRANMDLSVRPGDDFVEYATGSWLKNNPLRADQTENGAFEDLYELNQKQIQEIILQYANAPQEKGTLGQKIGSLYNLKMDSVRLNREGWAPIKNDLEKVRAISNKDEYQIVIAQLDRRGGNTMMFRMGVDADLRQADMNIVTVSQGGLGLGEPSYYTGEDEQTVRVREAYKAYQKKLLMLVGYDEATAQAKVDANFAIEKRLAAVSYSRVKLRDINANYHKMSLSQLLADYPGIEWVRIFWESGFPSFDKVDVGQPEPIHEVEKILAETSLDDLKTYAEIRVISGAAGSLSDDFVKASFEFRSVLRGQPQDDPRWKKATNLVNGVLGEAIGKMYCEKYFPESSKQHMLQLVHNLQVALAQRIDEATWMGPETKAQAKDKLQNFIVKIGYPDKWKDYSKLEVCDSLSLYENLSNISEYMTLDELNRKVGKPVDKTEWGMTPQTINAYYNPTTNEICFPAGILQPPFFDPNADDALNYGAIGGVIGHEMSHGFDDEGCQFDKTGNQRNWWTDADKANFDARTKVLANHFSNFVVVNGKKVNGQQTLGENIGDNGGLNIALRAMHNAGVKETIDGFTPDQRFFLAWARVWAANVRPEYTEMLMTMDTHSPNVARVNAALPMINEWYTAFGVKKGNKIFVAKKNRAQIW